MRHVTDGELHAYLDGALDLLPQGRGDEVREHLTCGLVFHERLQDEEKVREQAQGILALSAPGEVGLPPFEELRARAEAAGAVEDGGGGARHAASVRYRGPLRGAPLAWAATVVLALGVGWMGGEVWRAGPQDTLMESYVPESMAEPASLTDDQEAGLPPVTPDQAAGPARPLLEVGSVEEAEAGRRFRAESEAEPEPLPKAGAGVQGEELRTEPASSLFTPPALIPPSPSRTAADTAFENSLAVPGLEVLSVEWEEWVPGERGLHIRQLLPMGDTLELRYLGMLMGVDVEYTDQTAGREADPDPVTPDHPPFPKVMEASLPPGWNQVVMRRGRGWLVARAPLSEASLKAFLRTLR